MPARPRSRACGDYFECEREHKEPSKEDEVGRDTAQRLNRVPWIGVSRHVVVNRRTHGANGGARADRDGVVDAQDFFAYQQRLVVAGVGA